MGRWTLPRNLQISGSCWIFQPARQNTIAICKVRRMSDDNEKDDDDDGGRVGGGGVDSDFFFFFLVGSG